MNVVSHTFERQPPAGFQGLRSDLPISFYSRHLPHWRREGATYFVTFRLNDALPPDALKELRQLRFDWELKCPQPRTEKQWEDYARAVTQKSETFLDQSYGSCLFRKLENAELLRKALTHYQTTRCFVSCLNVMPNHAHAIMKPHKGFPLEQTLKLIKGYVSRVINVKSQTAGSLWEQESYDRIVRDCQHLDKVIQYIGRNGVSARLPSEQYIRWIDPAWQQAGWDFSEGTEAQ
jgi:REP element-mobilizing transposase RayT